tara:strand:+ start:5820 stop:6269 length:450 start_codon:yes stop_codon:yes gene_type:complete
MKDNDLYLIAEQYNTVLTEEEKKEREKIKAIDALQAALDVAGFEPTYGTIADGINVIISTLRSGLALARKEGDQAKEHIIDAGISAISLIPFADVIKVLKLRKLGKFSRPATKLAIAGGRAAKQYGKSRKIDRIRDLKPNQDLDNFDLA